MDIEHVKAIVSAFNDCINAQDLDRLSSMMTDEHVFIDTVDNRVAGKPACVAAWTGFFQAFPDYRNDFERISQSGELVVISGCAFCADPRLDGPALWTAKVSGDRVSEWRVLDDTSANRNALGLDQ